VFREIDFLLKFAGWFKLFTCVYCRPVHNGPVKNNKKRPFRFRWAQITPKTFCSISHMWITFKWNLVWLPSTTHVVNTVRFISYNFWSPLLRLHSLADSRCTARGIVTWIQHTSSKLAYQLTTANTSATPVDDHQTINAFGRWYDLLLQCGSISNFRKKLYLHTRDNVQAYCARLTKHCIVSTTVIVRCRWEDEYLFVEVL